MNKLISKCFCSWVTLFDIFPQPNNVNFCRTLMLRVFHINEKVNKIILLPVILIITKVKVLIVTTYLLLSLNNNGLLLSSLLIVIINIIIINKRFLVYSTAKIIFL